MGCFQSKSAPAPKARASGQNGHFGEEIQFKKTLNPDDFVCRDKVDEIILREAPTIDGQQFVISDCSNCFFFIADHLDSITMDGCTNCFLFAGPSCSSVFIRECENCKFIIAVQQLRTRDCKHLQMCLFCQTDPTLETSSDIQLNCFVGSYFSLEDHMNKANLSVWNNCWRKVFDFSKRSSGSNWSELPPEAVEQVKAVVDEKLPADFRERISFDFAGQTIPLVPYRQAAAGLLVCLAESASAVAFDLVARVASSEDVSLCRTRCIPLAKAEGRRLGLPRPMLSGRVIGLELDCGSPAAAEALLGASVAAVSAQSADRISHIVRDGPAIEMFLEQIGRGDGGRRLV